MIPKQTNGKILRTGEDLWLVMFIQQLTDIAFGYHLNTWNDEEYKQCLWVLHDIGKLN